MLWGLQPIEVTSISSNYVGNGEQQILTALCGRQPIEVTSISSNYVRNGEQQILTELCGGAAYRGHIDLVKLCKEWVATDFNSAMCEAAGEGHIDLVKLCKEWGATDFSSAMDCAVYGGHVDIVKLFRDWVGFEAIHQELFRHHHKRKFFRSIHDGVLPIAWHPDRFWNWCVGEEEKGFLKGMWES